MWRHSLGVLVALIGVTLVGVLMVRLADPSSRERHQPVAHAQPVDPVTGQKLNWITYLYEHSEAFKENRLMAMQMSRRHK